MKERYEQQEAQEEQLSAENDCIETDEKKKPSLFRQQLLLFVQAGICAAVLTAAFIIRSVGGTLYSETADYYFDSYNDTIFTTSQLMPVFFGDETSVAETSLRNYPENGSDTKSLFDKAILPLKSGRLVSVFKEGDSKGVDIETENGSEIYAALDGKVTAAGSSESLGNYLVIDHGSGIQTLYAHCGALKAKKGSSISSGDVIALAGSPEDSNSPCLHFELIRNGVPADPSEILHGAYQ